MNRQASVAKIQAAEEIAPLMGNEAIARGAWEAGVRVAAAYPGTPSTEILETLARYPADDLYAEWSTNEKVALDVAIGAALSGVRALAAMKHVGLNVAADSLMSQSYIGVHAGLVHRRLRRPRHPFLAERAGHPPVRALRRRARARAQRRAGGARLRQARLRAL